jgi:glycosyltransferase involved in cell wall biosynthesis
MNELPGVDVVIATRNRPELVRQAVDAVWRQTYRGAIRCVVVFDQSPPDPDLCRRADDRLVEVVENTRRPGLAGARNTGILLGGNELVAFCDDDDVWLPDKLAKQVRRMRETGEPTSVGGIFVEYGDRSIPRIPTPGELDQEHLVRHRVMAAHPSTVVVMRDLLVGEIGLVDEDIPGSYGEDFDWILRASQAGGFAVVSEPLVRVRWGQSQFSQRWQTIVDAIDYGLAKHEAFHRDPRALGRLYGRRAFALAAMHSPGTWAAVLRTVRVAPLERRAWIALLVALRLITAERVMDLAHRRGHGI